MWIRNKRIIFGLIAALFALQARADGITTTGTSASAIVGACSATSGQVLYDNTGVCAGIVPDRTRFVLTGVNFNVATSDNSVLLTLPVGIARYAIDSVRISKASASISTATVGVFTGAGGTGQTIAATQAVTVTATATDTVNNTMALTLTNGNTEAYNDTTLFFRITVAQGSAATADVIIDVIWLT